MFGSYTSLYPRSITSWEQLEERFHAHLFDYDKMMILDLIVLSQ